MARTPLHGRAGTAAAEGVVIDRHDSDFESAGEARGTGDVARPDRRPEPVAGLVGAAHRLRRTAHAYDGEDGAEGLVGHDFHPLAASVEQGGREKEALAGRRAAAHDHGALGPRVGDVGDHRLELPAVRERADVGEAIGADAQLDPGAAHGGDEGVGDALVDVGDLDGAARLADVRQRPVGNPRDRTLEVTVGEDDGGVALPAHLDARGDAPLRASHPHGAP